MMMNSRNMAQMQKTMRSMGIQTANIEVKRVILDYGDRREVIADPKVVKMTMQGVDTYQVVGQAQPLKEGTAAPAAPAAPAKRAVSDEDVELVVQQTGASRAAARTALEETGDLAEAILRLAK